MELPGRLQQLWNAAGSDRVAMLVDWWSEYYTVTVLTYAETAAGSACRPFSVAKAKPADFLRMLPSARDPVLKYLCSLPSLVLEKPPGSS